MQNSGTVMELVELLMGIQIFFPFLLRESLSNRTILTHLEACFNTENFERQKNKLQERFNCPGTKVVRDGQSIRLYYQ